MPVTTLEVQQITEAGDEITLHAIDDADGVDFTNGSRVFIYAVSSEVGGDTLSIDTVDAYRGLDLTTFDKDITLTQDTPVVVGPLDPDVFNTDGRKVVATSGNIDSTTSVAVLTI